jgi:hypothetical protein
LLYIPDAIHVKSDLDMRHIKHDNHFVHWVIEFLAS